MKVRMVLAAKSLPWDEVFIESWKFDHFQPEYLELNPSGTVPTFVEDGHIQLLRFGRMTRTWRQ
jgi:glutathione S-transferase